METKNGNGTGTGMGMDIDGMGRAMDTDLPKAHHRQIRNDIYLLRHCECFDHLTDLEDELFDQVRLVVQAVHKFAR